MNPNYPLVAERALHRCEYCHAPESIFNFPFEVEHITPFARGGGDNSLNWALACRSCNLRKGIHLDFIDPISNERVPLFHPRQDVWSQHFAANIESGLIVGLTLIGRATVACLDMNSIAQTVARQQWLRLGIFP